MLDVIKRIKSGDTRAFGTVYDAYYKQIASVLRKIGRCPVEDLDDHLNEVFFRIYRAIMGRRNIRQPATYFYSIARNYAFEKFRKSGSEKEKTVSMSDEQLQQGFEPRLVDALTLEKALDRLPIRLRSVLVFFYYENLSARDIAAIEQCSEDAVKNRLMRGRRRLKELLQGEGYG